MLPLLPAAGVTWSRTRSMGRGWMIPPFLRAESLPVPDTSRIPQGISLPISTASVRFAAGSGQGLSISLTTARPEGPPPALPTSLQSFSLVSWPGGRAMRRNWMVLSHFSSFMDVGSVKSSSASLSWEKPQLLWVVLSSPIQRDVPANKPGLALLSDWF